MGAPTTTVKSDAAGDRLLRYAKLYDSYLGAEIDMTRSAQESMENQWYESVGRSAAQVIYAACVSSWLGEVRTVLDMPCGHGRVLRHIVKLFPEATFDACDLDAAGVEFCARQFGATPVISNENPADVSFPRYYDVIWVGSLFTHLPHGLTSVWMKRLSEQLSPAGIVVATFHGRYVKNYGDVFEYIDQSRWEMIKSDYESSGYGYAAYDARTRPECIGGDYGISLSRPEAIIADALSIPGVRVFSYGERAWAGHHDVLVFGKPELMK